jgi:hypothetical protein
LRVQEEHLADPNTIPLTPEEVSIRVLKPRSGYVKGLGMRPSSSFKTKSSSAYVKQLEECIIELQETNRRQEEERKEMRERRKRRRFLVS